MCKEMTVIPVNRVVDKKRIIGKNGQLRRGRGTKGLRRRGTKGSLTPPPSKKTLNTLGSLVYMLLFLKTEMWHHKHQLLQAETMPHHLHTRHLKIDYDALIA
jgi:hypothetical protein